MTEPSKPDRSEHHVGPVSDDLTDQELRELGGELFDQITESPPEPEPPSNH